MFRLQSIQLFQFRNYRQAEFHFTERIVGISGFNGTGKTNLLDAIYYLGFSRSYFSRPDTQNVHHGTIGMRIDGLFQLNDQEHRLACILRENNRKEITRDGETYKKSSDHIGRFPCVIIAPDDVALIADGSEERRKFIDTILSQLSQDYMQQLIDYNKILQQRNSMLRQMAESIHTDVSLMQVLNEQLASRAGFIFEERKKFLTSFLPVVITIYNRIAGKAEGLKILYESQLLHADMESLLKVSQQKDLALQRTTAGIHRDDLVFLIDRTAFKSEASQGQRKSLLFALKLAEWQVLKENKGFSPILLLDDVFEKLDEQRMLQLLHWVCAENDGQIFITDTHRERLAAHLDETGEKYQLIQLNEKIADC
jgi:DNA replication and repair protein RecF